MTNNLLECFINWSKEINSNYTGGKRYYRLFRLIDVFRWYLIHTREYKAEHKDILLDVLNQYYCLALTKML